MYKKINW